MFLFFCAFDSIAAKDKNAITVLMWNYHDDDTTGPAEKVLVQVKDIPAKQVMLTEYRIDKEHSNSYEVWKQMGAPKQPTQEQVAVLEKAGQLQAVGKPVRTMVKNGVLSYNAILPRQAVSLLKLEW